MAQSFERELDELRCELSAVTFLTELLYCMHFRQLPRSTDRFAQFSAELKERIEALTIPGVDAIQADHAAQGWLEAISPVLDRIGDRLRDPEWSAREPRG
jgi:hypothetical protein